MSGARDQDNQRRRTSEDLLAEVDTHIEQLKTPHNKLLVPLIQALRQAAHERRNRIGGPQCHEPEASTKTCPYCGDFILAVARNCIHCGSMLDGSEPAQEVMGTAADPFAQPHTQFAGKKKGKLSVFGYLGIALGFVCIVAACVPLEGVTPDEAGGIFGLGAGLAVACSLWARKNS